MNIYSIQTGFGKEVEGKISYNIYFSGCRDNKKCDRENCQNKELHDFKVGTPYHKYLQTIKEALSKDFYNCICLLGGEPLDQPKSEFCYFVSYLYSFGLPIYLYTGYELEDLEKETRFNKSYLEAFDGIFIGHYDKINGTTNQRWVYPKKKINGGLDNVYQTNL